MSVIVIIPARYASTRLPGKPLLAQTGRCLIQHVVEAVRPARRVDRVVVATDDERIVRAVTQFGGEAIMTRPDHANGTDRLAEACRALGLADDDIVVNVQGDEPDITASLVDELVALLESSGRAMATLATPLGEDEAADAHKVKVVFDTQGKALYFSRAKIPFDRDGDEGVTYYLHLGLYAYRVGFLQDFASLAPTPLGQAEKLEQLRALEHGHAIAVGVVSYTGCGIDTPQDYAEFVRRMKG